MAEHQQTRAEDERPDAVEVSCPAPLPADTTILMGHGGGGRLTHQLIERLFLPLFANPQLDARHDGALLSLPVPRVAFTTDTYVVRPLFFPGGDIGKLAVCGTVNDLAMCGARPLYLSAGFVLEEGLPLTVLSRVVASMQNAAEACSVAIVTGDTKVVDGGRGDGLYVNTAGVGVVEHDRTVGPGAVRPGDAVLVSGDIGRHGIAVMAQREGLEFETTIESDCASVAEPALDLLRHGLPVHCLRDLTRGGLAAALVEIAEASGWTIALDEASIPVCQEVAGACEILGFDPLYVANEGRFLCILPREHADAALAILHQHPVSAQAVYAGEVTEEREGVVILRTAIGAARILDLFSGEQLPRIC
ncbi:MAG: hydrogenase expression/formation protein HypE [Chthonomonadales bacterium]